MKAAISIFALSILVASGVQAGPPVSTTIRSTKAVQDATPRLAPALAAKGLTLGQPIFIRIFKEEAELEVWLEKEGQFTLFKTWPIAAFSGFLGPKTKQGDCQAPEGFYFVTAGMMNPYSNFHLSFNLGYPNRYDRNHGYTGSALMVHGNNVSIGCYAMTDFWLNMQEGYNWFETNGTPPNVEVQKNKYVFD